MIKPNGPTFLGREVDRTNPDRLKIGVMSVADQSENKIEVIERESVLSKILKGGKLVATALVALAGVVLAAKSQGIVLPPQVETIALAILGIGSAIGLKGALDKNGDGKIDAKDFE
jgi:hypothetical protein